MASSDPSELEHRYFASCEKHGVLPCYPILLSLSRVKNQTFGVLEIVIDQLICSDIPPLVDAFSSSGLSGIDAVNICQRTCNPALNGECILSLLNAVSSKLHVVDLIDWVFWKYILQDIFQNGLACQVLSMRFCPVQKLNMSGNFMQLQTLNLDLSIHLCSFQVDSFTSMPRLMQLSLCGTRVSNLWTMASALSKLPSLVELRFQSCLCCSGTGPCPKYGGASTTPCEETLFSPQRRFTYARRLSYANEKFLLENLQCIAGGTLSELYSDSDSYSNNILQTVIEESSDDGESEFSGSKPASGHREEASSDTSVGILEQTDLHNGELSNENQGRSVNMLDAEDTGSSGRPTREAYHPSPICFEKYYRDYMISLLKHLKVLDNLPVKSSEREKAIETVEKYYEYVPYNRCLKQNVVSALQNREMGRSSTSSKTSKLKQLYSRESHHSHTRSLAASKVSSSTWPHLQPISRFRSATEGVEIFRPRQFEYHPSNPSLMVFGTLNGELVVINHESQKLVGYLPSVGALHSILGLCWLKSYPSQLIAGSDNGSLQLFDVSKMSSAITDRFCIQDACRHTFVEFEQLTSVNVNSTDDFFLASGFSRDVALYDVGSGRRLQFLKDLHQEHINVVKFSHHAPMIFATASFDQTVKMWDLRQGTSRPCYTACSSKGNVMVCFSPDDHYLLASAIDNEVKQLLAVDGRLHLEFDIDSMGSTQNYTRSYYMNGRDHIISGSCEENVVRVCCAQTGRRLRDLSFEDGGSCYSMFVQSLRGDPYRPFHMSVLVAYMRPCTRSEIIKVNMLTSGDGPEDDNFQHQCTSLGMGG